MDAGLEIIPVLNKIDLPGAEPDRRAQELHELIGAKPEEILRISAKEGANVPELLEALVRRIPAPRGVADAPLRALIFDSYYDRYRGAIPSIRVVDGTIRPGMKIAFGAHKDDVYEVDEVGYLQLGHKPTEQLAAGEVGYFVANVRGVRDTRPGDTVFDADHRDVPLLPGYRDIMSMVFAGLYPTNAEQFEELRDALAKLQLNDGSLHYEPESSVALGFGFRCGFLGLLHMEIVRERLEREFNLDLISTVPNVEYHVHKTDGAMDLVENPSLLPHGSAVDRIEEPYVKARIVAPAEYIGAIMKLGQERRGVYGGMHYVDPTRGDFTWEVPLAEIILDFYDKLKTISRGYASLDYEFLEYRPADLVKLDMLLIGDVVLTTPLLEALAVRHGPVDVVSTPAAAPLVETHPAVRRVIPYDKKGQDRGLAGLLRLARTLRAERYECAYLPHRSLRSALAAWLARIPRRGGFCDEGGGAGYPRRRRR